MKLQKWLLITAGLLVSFASCASELSEKLASPNYVLLMRHARAPGTGDPPHYSLDDCKTQRNLSAEGRTQAQTVGNWLRKQGVHEATVYASAWCRCKDTAALLNFGEFQVEASLASFFDEMEKAEDRTTALQSFISERLKTKGTKALILVSHHVNIYAYMGENIASADMVLVKVDASGKMVSYKVIPRPS